MSSTDQSEVEPQLTPEIRQSLKADSQMWAAVLARDNRCDGDFVFAVRSTDIYCRPSCPAKRPSRDKVMYFSGPAEAEESGFRPCRRCDPRIDRLSTGVEPIDRACKYIEANLDDKLTLSNLGVHAGISPYHLQRTFKRIVGISPREYVEARRLARMKLLLKTGHTVTKALYGAGFTSRSRFYDKNSTQFGMSAGAFRRGGEGVRIEYAIVNCPLGRLLVATTLAGLCAVFMGDTDAVVESALSKEYPHAHLYCGNAGLQKWIAPIMNYFAGHEPNLNLPLDVEASTFQRRVWKEIRSIPYGSTSTYSKIASQLGTPKAARAVAKACATNPISIVIPCHRVIGKNGDLRGYRWGEKRKKDLLTLERTYHS
jgi:AraC family transcriptional regulator of adaptative response/methylated-DNA-[protein]-cysteine methyltransferase